MGNGTFVGLDVHARSVVAGLIDEGTGEVRVKRAPHRTEDLLGWLNELAGPVQVAYEAGPTGYGLARACEQAGIRCLVAAPSLIPRSPAGRGRKSDASDAEQLARLLRAGELVRVRVPDAADEAARDLVRAAWHHRRPVRASREIARRRAGQRPEVCARAEQAGLRLHRRWAHLEGRRGLRSTLVATAVARELAGWCWSLAVME